VIVKIAETMLTPDKPAFDEGTWHVEGMTNEQIVATGIYYFAHSGNLSQSLLRFRRAVQDFDTGQDDEQGLIDTYAMRDSQPQNQSLGYIETKEDRCIAFPNVWQHRVDPFHTVDGAPAHRKILVFFLVDPLRPVVSTARVPVQRTDWLAAAGVASAATPGTGVPRLPSAVEWPLTWERACEVRTAVMAERRTAVRAVNDTLFEVEFSMCEH